MKTLVAAGVLALFAAGPADALTRSTAIALPEDWADDWSYGYGFTSRAVEKSFRRTGNSISYTWKRVAPNGSRYDLNISLNFSRGWDYMQSVYRKKDHRGTYEWERKFVHGDPFAQDLRVVASALRGEARLHGLSEIDVALSFVQSFPHVEGMGHYQRYAVETLIDRKGDCSDKSMLLGGIFGALGYDYVWINLPEHLAVGIWMHPSTEGTYYVSRGRRYYYCETNSELLPLGRIPDQYRRMSATVSHVW